MGDLLYPYVIIQETEWAGRRFCTAREQLTGQIVYLVGEPAGHLGGSYAHPNLPALKELGTDGKVRWWVGSMPEGEKLEDARLQGNLTESELLSALLSVIDALLGLAAMLPAPVPAYLDPSCIVRDRMGRWVLDYLALAHAPEAHSSGLTPLGVYPFGILLYWVVTGETVRRSRVQVSSLEKVASPGLQLVIIRCLGRSYPSLAELRAELSRIGKDREFQPLVHRMRAKARSSRSEVASTLLRGPHIPIDDRPWAAPPPIRAGTKLEQLPIQYRRVRRSRTRWVSLVLVGLFTLVVAGAAALQMGMVPLQFQPAWLRAIPHVSFFPKPEPVRTKYAGSPMEGERVLVYLDGQTLGEALIYTSPNYPYMALPDLNRMFGRKMEIATETNGQMILREGTRRLTIMDYEPAGQEIWIKMIPAVQQWMGLRFQSYRSGILHFSTKA